MTSRPPPCWDDETLSRVVAYLDWDKDPTDPENVWQGLQFMEANGLDFALRCDQLHGYLTEDESGPVARADVFAPGAQRSLVLALRRRAREELALPPLSPDEERDWTYPSSDSIELARQRSKPQHVLNTYRASQEELKQTIARLKEIEPELVRAIELFAQYNRTVGGNRSALLGVRWIRHRLDRLLPAERPELSHIEVSNLAADALNLVYWSDDTEGKASNSR